MNKVWYEVHDPSVGLFPVSDECVSAAQSRHGNHEDERMGGQEKLKSKDPGHWV